MYIICKHLFRFGVKSLTLSNGQVILSLSYTPKGETLRKKFRKFPVQYIRLAMENEEEVRIFQEALQEYNFSLSCDDDDDEDALPPPAKRQALPPLPPKIKKPNKFKLLENRLVTPGSSTSSSSNQLTTPGPSSSSIGIEIYDDDADEFCSQKFHYT
ncbi:hypothetical protein MML48_5g00008524 [Holotrichia oblita]|uniref:Uncharacterized protein n=2 Tax=Holotrichia oblita TaxID=644536 RepID=A0ACB9SGD1_HOLOL|nr:hypothetical protein MML48_10g00021162 [Holotrichia oblita]KAI4460986.1 hypothetical protein MML48_5g00008524 [Holotrichia oblita]